MPSLPAGVMHRLIKNRMEKINRSIAGAGDLAAQIDAYRRELAIDAGTIVLGDCQVEEGMLGGRPVLWFGCQDSAADRVVLFLHGGGYVGGNVHNNRNMASDLVRAIGQRVVSLDYRLAPENPYPAALNDVLAAFDDLISKGYDSSSITLLGCSAGGGLAIAAALAIRDSGRPLPGAIVGLSPWCDLTLNQVTVKANSRRDIVLTPELLAAAADLYAAGHDRSDPLISPIYGDLTGLPPILLQVAAEELMLGEVIALADKAEKSGVIVDLEIWDGLWHVWQYMNELVPESHAAQLSIGRFIRQHTWPRGETPPQTATDPRRRPVRAVLPSDRVGLVHVLCGNGRGKTTAAIGLMIRAIGHGRRAMLVQFLKNGLSGELKSLRTLPGIHVISGQESTLFSHVMNEEQRTATLEQHRRFLSVAVRAARTGRIDLLILDEVLDAVNTGMLPEFELLEFLRSRPPGLEVVLTGRDPSAEVLALADYISDIHSVRHPYDRGIEARIGIEY